jgi:hypothetical protein
MFEDRFFQLFAMAVPVLVQYTLNHFDTSQANKEHQALRWSRLMRQAKDGSFAGYDYFAHWKPGSKAKDYEE